MTGQIDEIAMEGQYMTSTRLYETETSIQQQPVKSSKPSKLMQKHKSSRQCRIGAGDDAAASPIKFFGGKFD